MLPSHNTVGLEIVPAYQSAGLENRTSSESSALGFLRRQFSKPKPLPSSTSLNDQVVIITGSSTGLGFEAARKFLKLGISHLVMAVRSQKRGDAAAEKLRGEFPKPTLCVWLLDMESPKSIQAFAEHCTALPRIDIAVLNAAIQKPSFTLSPETGRETMMQVNYLSTIMLAILLLPVLKTKKQADAVRPPTISIVGSDLAYMFDIQRDSPILRPLQDPTTYDQYPLYSRLKLLLLLATAKLCESIDRENVIINVTNPGMTKGTPGSWRWRRPG